MPDIISICFIQPATVDLATALCGIIKVIIEKLDFFLPRLMFFLYNNLKPQPHTMLYLIETHKFFTKEEIHPLSKTSPRLLQYSLACIIWFKSKICRADILDDVLKAKRMVTFSVSSLFDNWSLSRNFSLTKSRTCLKSHTNTSWIGWS